MTGLRESWFRYNMLKITVFTSWGCLLGLAAAAAADPALTIYNQNFAVVRDTIPLNLQPGLNDVKFANATASLEPDSVVLRDTSGTQDWQVMEQFYRADVLSQGYLLWLNEGKLVQFRVRKGDTFDTVWGKVIRSGYGPTLAGAQYYNGGYYTSEGSYIGNTASSPIIEVQGVLQFSLPGEPIFTELPSTATLKPSLNWKIRSDVTVSRTAELAFVSRGFNWQADYNLIAPAVDNGAPGTNEILDLTGLVTLYNTSGNTYENVGIKLMAGDVSKVQAPTTSYIYAASRFANESVGNRPAPVSEKTFDEYHLYTLNGRTTLRDRETKQVEFLHAPRVQATYSYVYDGMQVQQNSYSYGYQSIREDESFGTQSNAKVWVMREFANTKENGLGVPLPKGRLRFYRRDTDGQLEFVGENIISHTPQGETVRIFTGNAFDLVGGRKRTSYKIDREKRMLDETFEITLRNRKTVPVEIRVREHPSRGENWTIPQKSNAMVKTDSNTIEFRVQVPPDGEKVVTYSVHYTW